MHYKDVICNCLGITVDDIKNAIENGNTTFEEIKEVTRANTGCGMCKNRLKEVIDDLQK